MASAPPAEGAVKELAKGVDQLVRQMRAEQKVVREWVDEQAAQQSEVASVLKDLAANSGAQGIGQTTWRDGRSRTVDRQYGEFWPGYVDVLSTLLLVVTFLMSIFMVAQFYASQEASGKDTALRRLTRQIAELTNLLSLEKGKGKSLEDELAAPAGVAGHAEGGQRAARAALAGGRRRQGCAHLGAHQGAGRQEDHLERGAGQGRSAQPAAAGAAPPDRRPAARR